MMFIKDKLILIGASTGGPGHLKKIFTSLDSGFSTPVIIAQHMNCVFIKSFVKQFDDELPFNFYLADSKHDIKKHSVHICGTHCEISKRDGHLKLQSTNNVISNYNPSVDCLFNSAIELCSDYDVLAVLLTGIGSDGAKAMSNLKDAGATCIAESEESAIVYGMPKKAAEFNSKIKVMNLNDIIKYIKRFGN